MIEFHTDPPMTLCKTRVFNIKTNEVYIADWKIPTEEYLKSQLEKINDEIANAEHYLNFLKGHKNYCKQCLGIHKKQKRFNSKGENNGK